MKLINKIAFIVHEPTMYIHYAPVWAQLPRERFAIILYGDCALDSSCSPMPVLTFRDKIRAAGYETVRFVDLVRTGTAYRYVVSNHCLGGKGFRKGNNILVKSIRIGKRFLNQLRVLTRNPVRYGLTGIDPYQYRPLQVGKKQIRFMYGADISPGWSLQSWNQMYDLFLCHGPNDAAILGQQFRGKTVIMGYPRYDGYFDPDLDTSAAVEEFGIDPEKKTILWMPTTGAKKGESGKISSIPHFAETVARLMVTYNVIVRPHPISFRNDPEFIKLLEKLNYQIDRDATRDMNRLFKIADYVLCDYGGSAFGAIYLDKNLVLLETPAARSAICAEDSSNLELHEHFPVLTVENADSLEGLLADPSVWQEQKNRRKQLFDKYFADNRGESARCAAEILSNLDEILKDA